MTTFNRKPRSALRHWSTYATVGEWFKDYHGYVPIQMPHALQRFQQANPGMTFREAYAGLLGAAAIIHFDPANDDIPEDPVGS